MEDHANKTLDIILALQRFIQSGERESVPRLGCITDSQDLSAAMWHIQRHLDIGRLSAEEKREIKRALVRAKPQFRERYPNFGDPVTVSKAFDELLQLLSGDTKNRQKIRHADGGASEWLRTKLHFLYLDHHVEGHSGAIANLTKTKTTRAHLKNTPDVILFELHRSGSIPPEVARWFE